MGDEFGDFAGVRILKFVDDVAHESGVIEDPDRPRTFEFEGPGFLGLTPEGDEVLFTLEQIVPESNLKYYFPDDEYDDWDREVPNPYRKLAGKLAIGNIERA